MNLKEALISKSEEVFDLYSRGLLTIMYANAWEDVVSICNKYQEKVNIHIFANENNSVVRFWCQDGAKWNGSIRYKIGKVDAKIFIGANYEDCENKVRGYFKNNTLKQVAYKDAK